MGDNIGNRLYVFLGALVIGLLIGFIDMIFNGLTIHIFAKLAGGVGKIRESFNLALYAGIPVYLLILLYFLLRYLVDGWSANYADIGIGFTFIKFILFELVLIYSIVLCYKGVRVLHQLKRAPAIFFFLLLPIFLSLFQFIPISAIMYFSNDPDGSNILSMGQIYANCEQYANMIKEGEMEEAENLFKIEITDSNKEVREQVKEFLLLNCKIRPEDDSEKIAAYYYLASLMCDSNSAERYMHLGNVGLNMGHIDSASYYFERALELDSNNSDAHNNLGLIYLNLDQYDKALPHNLMCFQLDSNFTTTLNLAFNYYYLNNNKNALRLFLTLFDENPNDAMLLYYLGLIFYEEKEFEKAHELIKMAIKLDPEYSSTLTDNILEITSQ
jgi:Flp pilus assembly protein TadD